MVNYIVINYWPCLEHTNVIIEVFLINQRIGVVMGRLSGLINAVNLFQMAFT